MTKGITKHPNGGGVAVGARLDVRAMMSHYLAPFKATEAWKPALAIAEQHKWGIDRDVHGELYALRANESYPGQKAAAVSDAMAIFEAARPVSAIAEAADAVLETMKPPSEPELRLLIGTMLDGFRAKPTEGAAVYIDAMVWMLSEPESGQPFCAPAIAAAIRQAWASQTFPPSVHEFLKLCSNQQERIEAVHQELEWLCGAASDAVEVLLELAPEKLPKRSNLPDWSDEEYDEIFGPE
jgi:hypothetical protein